MCHQTVGLVGAELERNPPEGGRRSAVVTASISLLPEITRKIRPPRALEVPYPLGFPLGRPNDPPLQRRILRALLRLTSRDDVPVIEELYELATASRDSGPETSRLR